MFKDETSRRASGVRHGETPNDGAPTPSDAKSTVTGKSDENADESSGKRKVLMGTEHFEQRLRLLETSGSFERSNSTDSSKCSPNPDTTIPAELEDDGFTGKTRNTRVSPSIDTIRSFTIERITEETPKLEVSKETIANDGEKCKRKDSVNDTENTGEDSTDTSITDSEAESVVPTKTYLQIDPRAIIEGVNAKAQKDAKEIINTQKEGRRHTVREEKVLPPISRRTRQGPAAQSNSGCWSRCPCDALKRDAKLKTKVCAVM